MIKNFYLTVCAIIITSGEIQAAMPSDDAFMNALPKIKELLTKEKDETCNQAEYMNKIILRQEENGYQVPERIKQNLNSWEKACYRLSDFIRIFTDRNENLILENLKNLYRDPDVANIIDEEEKKINDESHMVTKINDEELLSIIRQNITRPEQLCEILKSNSSKDQLDWIFTWIAPTQFPKNQKDRELKSIFDTNVDNSDRLYNCLFKPDLSAPL